MSIFLLCTVECRYIVIILYWQKYEFMLWYKISECLDTSFFLLSLYSGGEVWKGIWNPTHLVVLNFSLLRLQHGTVSHDKVRSNRRCQWPELFRTYKPANFCNRDSGFEESHCIDMTLHEVQSPDANFLYEQSTWLTHLCRHVRSTFAVRETQSLGQKMLNAPVGING